MMHGRETSLALLRTQRSHILFVLSNPKPDHEGKFREWYRSAYREQIASITDVLCGRHYEKHPFDITKGQYMLLPFHYLALYEVSVDGAEAAAPLIDRIMALHHEQSAAQAPATWLYYPATEKVGRSPPILPSMLTVAFANGVPGQEDAFREWYATRHIRHALNIPALVSGQTFERTQFQRPGALEAKFATIAVYEQAGTPESILESFAALPPGALDFPMLDLSHFAESVYRPL